MTTFSNSNCLREFQEHFKTKKIFKMFFSKIEEATIL